jgi:hypothetical protein
MRNARRETFTIATVFHFLLTVSSTPALHASHSKQSTCWSLLHARQSPSLAAAGGNDPDLGASQNVAFTYRNLHHVGGLQQPDCTVASEHV